jgi:predicted ArsR family transcriptional regulator
MNNYNITLNKNELRVGGRKVATVSNFPALRDALFSNLTRHEAVYLAVSLLGEARTSEISKLLGEDKANTTKRLEALVDEGRIDIVEMSNKKPGPGRPSRVWAIAE